MDIELITKIAYHILSAIIGFGVAYWAITTLHVLKEIRDHLKEIETRRVKEEEATTSLNDLLNR